MSFVYILQSEKTGRYYIGSTNNLTRRISEHNSGKTRSLVNQIPLKVVFKMEFDNILEARKTERLLKKKKSRKIIDRIIKDGKIKMGL